jgi:hypothetical protein
VAARAGGPAPGGGRARKPRRRSRQRMTPWPLAPLVAEMRGRGTVAWEVERGGIWVLTSEVV